MIRLLLVAPFVAMCLMMLKEPPQDWMVLGLIVSLSLAFIGAAND